MRRVGKEGHERWAETYLLVGAESLLVVCIFFQERGKVQDYLGCGDLGVDG